MSKKSRDLASAAMALLAERFPRCFDERNRRPAPRSMALTCRWRSRPQHQ